MQTTTKAKVHLLYLDSLRGIAATLVVLHHAFLQVNLTGYSLTSGQEYLLGLFKNGHYPVNFFIVLSGYCLMLPVIRSDYSLPGGTLLFFKRRARRILPPYYLAMAFSLLLIATLIGQPTGTHWDVSIPVTKADLITHLLLIQDVFTTTGGKINHAFWSISVEWRIYFLFPVLLFLWRTIGARPTVLLTTLAALALVVVLRFLHGRYPDLNNTPNGIVPHYLLLFTLGMFGAFLAYTHDTLVSRWQPTQWAICLLAMTLLIAVASTIQQHYMPSFPWQLLDVMVGIWGVILLLLCHAIQHSDHAGHRPLKAIISWRPLVFTGTIGYSLYLIHAPLLQVLTQYFLAPLHLNPLTNFMLLATVGLVIIIGVSYCFFLVCEKPFMTKRQPTAALAAIAEPAI